MLYEISSIGRYISQQTIEHKFETSEYSPCSIRDRFEVRDIANPSPSARKNQKIPRKVILFN